MQDIDAADLRKISELIFHKYNYDFRNYALSSFRRRVLRILELKKLTPSSLLAQLAEAPRFIEEFVDALTVNVTEMFRDPSFWRVIRHQVIPEVASQKKNFRVWHAGCSSGEEVITMAIILKELGLLDRAEIMATDLDGNMLERAHIATYSLKSLAVHEKNYADFTGTPASLKAYYTEEGNSAVFDPELIQNVTYMRHDLVLGNTPGRYDIILCRNVMIYFNQRLQNEVLRKFYRALEPHGFLCIGSKESLIWCDDANRFTAVHGSEKVYRRK